MALRLPSHETIRGWMQRVGLGRLERVERKAGGTWLVDHTGQIGKEKVLSVLRVRSFRHDQALRYEDVEVLATLPGSSWKRDDVAAAYREIAARCGTPDSIVSDGAIELREPISTLEIAGKSPRGFRDMKHFLANQLERLLNKDADFQRFTKRLRQSRSSLQQTELAHFTPPSFKVKARFMNLEPSIRWASSVLWHLDHPKSKSCRDVSSARMKEKLSWLRKFRGGIERWKNCQAVISATLTMLNQSGLFHGVTAEYQQRIASLATCAASRQMVNATVAQLQTDESRLLPNERLPISTEILESSFARYKQLEQQHSKSGFTSLLLTYPTLLQPTTAAEVTACFTTVKVANVRTWAKTNLATTLTSQRQQMYREAKQQKTKPIKRATPLTNAR